MSASVFEAHDNAASLRHGASLAALADLLGDAARAVAEFAAAVEDGRMAPAGARERVRTYMAGVIGASALDAGR